MSSSTNQSSRFWSLSLALLLVSIHQQSFFVGAQVAKFDLNPVTNFCSRWWSQTIVKNNVLYVDSGAQKWNGSDISSPQFGINNYLLSIPLDTTWDWKTNIVINPNPKNKSNPNTGTVPPSLMRGHLFHGPASDPNIFIYGGTNYMANLSFPSFQWPDPSTYPLWTYNTTGESWNQHDLGLAWRPNHGAATEAIDQGLGFYLNGQIDWGTSTSTQDIPDLRNRTTYRALDGMLVINLNNYTATNVSTPGIQGGAPRVGGKMEYFPSIGNMGALVALGGQVQSGTGYLNVSEGRLINFTSVDVFDINSYLSNTKSNGTWYQQETAGNIPPARIDFCTVAMSAPDNSSHHIYLYGGRDPTNRNRGFDDVYVLSLPSFTWTAIFTDGGSPRWGHGCHRVGTRQMVTVGGNTSNSGDCDWELKGVAFLDMTTVTWGSVYLTNTSAYGVPQRLFAATGGTQSGNATVKEPIRGWTNQSLQTVFAAQRKWNTEPTNNTTPINPPASQSKTNTGAIAGGVVGGLASLALVAGAIFFLKRRRNRSLQPRELENNEVNRNELPSDSEKGKHELPGLNDNNPIELPAAEGTAELNAPRQVVEADRTTVVRKDTAELSGENVVKGGRMGVPIVRTPDDEMPSPPLNPGAYSPGISPELSDIKSEPKQLSKHGKIEYSEEPVSYEDKPRDVKK